MFANKYSIQSSSDLSRALSSKSLLLVKQTIISTNTIEPVQPSDPNPGLSEDKLKDIIRSVVQEQLETNKINSNLENTVEKAINSSMSTIMDSLRDKLNSVGTVNPTNKKEEEDFSVSPEKLAELQQKTIEKISQEMQSNENKKTKKIKITDHRLSDIANEL